MDMIERVARAICRVEYGTEDAGWDNQIPAAVAALEAMREPTLTMLYEGEGMCDYVMPEGFENTREARQAELRCGWQTMIDAALKVNASKASQTPTPPTQ